MNTIAGSLLQPGHQIAGYIVRRKVGSGGMGDVYLCDEPKLGRQVALKVIRQMDQEADAVSRFLQEGKALAKLNHPNIVSVYSLGEVDGLLYIAMEYVDGVSLFTHSRERKISLREILQVFRDAAEGLSYAHSAGLVHRDIKPANILVDRNGRGKLIDFGIAKSVGSEIGSEGVKTKTGLIIGTLNYIAPELFRGDPPSPLSDNYALGLCLFEAIFGRTPYRAESQFQTMEKIREQNLEIPDEIHFLFPEEFWTTFFRLIAKDPAIRSTNPVQVADKLISICEKSFPPSWSTGMAALGIDNLDSVQGLLTSLNVDVAERQFVLSLALNKPVPDSQASAGAGGTEDESVKTAFVSTAKIQITDEAVRAAWAEYRSSRDSLIEAHRKKSVDDLTPPPTSANVAKSPVGSVQESQAAQQVVTQPDSPSRINGPIPEKSSAFPKVFAIAAGALVVILGSMYYLKSLKEEEARKAAEVALLEAKAAAERRKSARGDRVLSPMSEGFAMVVEPKDGAWPSVEYPSEVRAGPSDWVWKVQSSKSPGRVQEIRESRMLDTSETSESMEKYRLSTTETRMENGVQKKIEKIGYEWFRKGHPALPLRTSGSSIWGSFGSAVVGQPERLFPLRMGKEVHYEIEIQPAPNSPFLPMIGRHEELIAGKMRFRNSCSIGEKKESRVKVSCVGRTVTGALSTFDSKIELKISMDWDLNRHSVAAYKMIVVLGSDLTEVHSIEGLPLDPAAR